jgi:hypothetical protein
MSQSAFDNYTVHGRGKQDVGITIADELAMLGEDANAARPKDPYDTEEYRLRLRRVRAWLLAEKELQHENRIDRLLDHDYYDGDQWDPEDAAVVEARGQSARVYNRIKPTILWITGTERRTRIDYRVLPRTKDDTKGAEHKTKLIKYVSDVNKTGHHRSRAFADAAKSGLGWIEIGVKSDPEDEPLFYRYEDWRNIWHDSMAVMADLSDARYLFRQKWVDLDIAVAMFPRAKHDLVEAANNSDWSEYFTDEDDVPDLEASLYENVGTGMAGIAGIDPRVRNRVRLVECWYRHPERIQMIRGARGFRMGTLQNATYDPANPYMRAMVAEGYATLHDAVKMVVRHMIYCENTILVDQRSPYAHNRFPFVPIWGYRRHRDGMPYGVIRNLRDPQDDLNKRRSKALFILSTNRVIADEGAAPNNDWQRFHTEAQRPDCLLVKVPGKEVRIESDTTLAEEHIMLMNQDAQYIEATGGVTDENMGRETNATSGRAIRARQDQGHTVTFELFDNLKFSEQLAGEIQLANIEQFYTGPKIIRLVGDKGKLEFEEINKPVPETGEILNDITASQADYVVDTQDWNATIRQHMFETMGEMFSRMDPTIVLQLMDLWIDLIDMPGKDEMVKRIRQINGQPDPDEDMNDPEVQARRKQQEEQETWQAEMERIIQEAAAEAALLANDEKRAKIEEILARAQKALADIGQNEEKVRIARGQALHQVQRDNRQATLAAGQAAASHGLNVNKQAMDRDNEIHRRRQEVLKAARGKAPA